MCLSEEREPAQKIAEERHDTSAPTPSRANYGFVLYLGSRTAFVIYLCWALDWGGFMSGYLPQRYWAVALPVHLLVSLAAFAFLLYPAMNLCVTPPPDDPTVLNDSHTLEPRPYPDDGIPQLYDLPMWSVCRTLYAD